MTALPRLPSLDTLVLGARLHARHPAASPEMVRRSIDAAVQVFSHARVRLYLPILIERAASETLRTASSSNHHAASSVMTSRGNDL